MAAKNKRLFTKCPDCQLVQAISVNELRDHKGQKQCESCHRIFYALHNLSNSAADISEPDQDEQNLAWNQAKVAAGSKHFWAIASISTGLLLLGQLLFFEGAVALQTSSTRSWLEKFCQALHCQLPAYENLQEISLLQGQLIAQPNHSIHFKTALTNQAAFAQHYPKLKLSLFDFAGNVFAQRLFKPGDYLTEPAEGSLLADASTEVNLTIVEPKTKIGGFSFDISY